MIGKPRNYEDWKLWCETVQNRTVVDSFESKGETNN